MSEAELEALKQIAESLDKIASNVATDGLVLSVLCLVVAILCVIQSRK